MDKIVPAKFKPRARLLLQLGDQLIKNESIAIIELVKNSYDADANRVTIYMQNVETPEEGIIIIEDDGFGMDLEIVENVWLEPGSDFKSEKFKKLEVTPKFNRLPIGEKGIGRFGVHKLGHIIEMTTKKENSNEVYVRINWKDFNNYKYLEQVPIEIIERSSPRTFVNGKTGTYIIIKDLRKEWTRGIARNIKRSVTSLVSPFETHDSFQANFDILDKPGWFEGLLKWEDIQHYSLFHFRITISGSAIKKFEYQFEPWSSMPQLSGRTITETDNLVNTYLTLEDEDGKPISLNNYSIGDIIFEGYIFDRDAFILRLGVSDKRGFKGYLDNNCGVRVFRDGLRIYDYGEPENDWLGLDLRRVNQPSKRLSNNIIMGAVYLKRADSSDLSEKTNREGFVENDAYTSFRAAILHTLSLVETLRYSDKRRIRDIYGPTHKAEPVLQVLGDLKDYVERHVESNDVKTEIVRQLIKIEDDYRRINSTLLKAAGAGLSMSVVVHEVEKIIFELEKVFSKEPISERAFNLVKHLSTLIDGYSSIIRKSSQASEDVRLIIDQALFNCDFRSSSHNIEVIRAYKEFKGNVMVKVSRSLLIGSLMNVIDNSIYWLDKANRPNKKIFIAIEEDEEDYINVIVADNGTGFLLPTDEVTEPFVSAKPDGMGLGLHIASEIMLANGGKLKFPDWGDFQIPDDFKTGAIVAFALKKI